jgi:hypothetical protein
MQEGARPGGVPPSRLCRLPEAEGDSRRKEHPGFVTGPFSSEAAFKAAVIAWWRRMLSASSVFEIENEEKEPGMPDVLMTSLRDPALFVEFKVSDKRGVIEFQRSQPLFYLRNAGKVRITILAWDVPGDRVVEIAPWEVVEAKSLKLKIPEVLHEVH